MIKIHYIVDVVDRDPSEFNDHSFSRSFDSAEEAVAFFLEIQERSRLYAMAFPRSKREYYAKWPHIDSYGIQGLTPLEFLRKISE